MCLVLTSGEELIVARRSGSETMEPADYWPCIHCLAFCKSEQLKFLPTPLATAKKERKHMYMITLIITRFKTDVAPNGQSIVGAGCITKGRGQCLYRKIYVKSLRGDRYK